MLTSLFLEVDYKCILSITVGSSNHLDKRIWHYNKNGRFSVRSAYHLEVRLLKKELNATESSSSAFSSGDWKWLWALNLPSKVKIFMWRACKDFLSTRINLVKRKVMMDNSCVFCRNREEEIMHCLIQCPLARQVWTLSNIPWSSYGFMGSDFQDWVWYLKARTDKSCLERCILFCWAIWPTRNKFMFEGADPNALEVVSFMQNYWSSLKKASATIIGSPNSSNSTRSYWQPPRSNFIKVNFDASINSTDGVCGLGAIARNSSGECVGWTLICVRQPLDPPSAEAKAALFATEFARAQSWNNIILEGDSSVIIVAINVDTNSLAGYGNIISDLQSLITGFGRFQAKHIGRDGNQAAHEVARLSFKESYVSNVLPNFIMNIVISDLSS